MNCNAHCRGCDTCFTGTSAFDRHRKGPHTARVCVDPDTVEKLHPHQGECRVSGAEVRPKRVVYATQER